MPRCRHGVGDPGDQRRLRADDHQIDPEFHGQIGDRGAVHRVHLVQGRDGGDAGVPGRRVNLGHGRIQAQRPGQRVLAATGSDDEDLHGPTLSAQRRATRPANRTPDSVQHVSLFVKHPKPDPVGPGQESVWDYPRPPRLERTTDLIEVYFGGVRIGRTTNGWRVLETSHPPTYYLPRGRLH